jgi:hypothetical protein
MQLGKYRHYKGGLYEVIGLATESDTEEDMVVYKSLETGRLFVRRKDVFLGKANKDGEECPRFDLVEAHQPHEPTA